MAKIISYGFGGVEPDEMGLGPIPASKMALKKVGLTIDDLDLVESNEKAVHKINDFLKEYPE